MLSNLSRIRQITPSDLQEENIGLKVEFFHLRTYKRSKRGCDAILNPHNFKTREKKQNNLPMLTKPQIKTLREEHPEEKIEVLGNGGKTVCHIINPKTKQVLSTGESTCSFLHDNFNRDVGRLKAFGLAISALSKESARFYQELLNQFETLRFKPVLDSKSLDDISIEELLRQFEPVHNLFSLDEINEKIAEISETLVQKGESIDNYGSNEILSMLLRKLSEKVNQVQGTTQQ